MKKLLLLLKLPPPVTGVTRMCSAVLENNELFQRFNTRVIGLSYAKDVKSTGGILSHPSPEHHFLEIFSSFS